MRPWQQTGAVFNQGAMNGVIERVRLFGQGAMNGAPTERRGRIYAPLASDGCGIQPGRHEWRH